MKVKTNELTGAALDYAVAKCEGYFDIGMASVHEGVTDVFYFPRWQPSTDWSQGGPIVERKKIAIDWDNDCWNASTDSHPAYYSAETPLIAAMRCYVASKLGDEVEVPEEVQS